MSSFSDQDENNNNLSGFTVSYATGKSRFSYRLWPNLNLVKIYLYLMPSGSTFFFLHFSRLLICPCHSIWTVHLVVDHPKLTTFSCVLCTISVEDPGGGRGAMAPPGPVKIGHKKDGCRIDFMFILSIKITNKQNSSLQSVSGNASSTLASNGRTKCCFQLIQITYQYWKESAVQFFLFSHRPWDGAWVGRLPAQATWPDLCERRTGLPWLQFL